MSTCQCDRIESKFDRVYADEKLQAYQQNGPDPSTRALIELLRREELGGMTLLDIGGGVGAVQHDLLSAGVVSAQEVEASAAYAAACREEATRQGHEDRVTHFVGEFGDVVDSVDDADIVTLDRSLCCWHDMPELVARSAAKARRFYGLVYPRDVWWVRYGWRLSSDLRNIARRNPMRVYTHRTRDVERVLRAGGLTKRSSTEVGVWQIAVYQASGDPSSLPEEAAYSS